MGKGKAPVFLPFCQRSLPLALIKAEQRQQFGLAQVLEPFFFCRNDLIGQGLFQLLPLEDLLFDGPLGDQPIHGHRLRLADAVGPVLGLAVVGRIPVVVVEDHGIGPREVQARASGFRADEEALDRRIAVELPDQIGPKRWRSIAVQTDETELPLPEEVLDDVEHLRALAEEQRPVFAIDDLFHEFLQAVQLPRVLDS